MCHCEPNKTSLFVLFVAQFEPNTCDMQDNEKEASAEKTNRLLLDLLVLDFISNGNRGNNLVKKQSKKKCHQVNLSSVAPYGD